MNQYAEIFFGRSRSLDDDNPSGRGNPMLYIIQTIEKISPSLKNVEGSKDYDVIIDYF